MGIKALLRTVTEPQTESDINTCRFTDIVKNFLKELYPVFFIITISVKHLFVVCIESGMDKHSFFHEGFINKKKLLHSLTDKIGFDQVIQNICLIMPRNRFGQFFVYQQYPRTTTEILFPSRARLNVLYLVLCASSAEIHFSGSQLMFFSFFRKIRCSIS